MKRIFALFILSLTVALGATGCSSQKMPDVTPTPTPVASPDMPDGTHSSQAPSATPSAMPVPSASDGSYYSDENGHVEGDAQNNMDNAGDAARDAVDDAGNAARDVIDGAGRAVEDIGRGVEDIGKGVERAVK